MVTKSVANGGQNYFIEDEPAIAECVRKESARAKNRSWLCLIGMELMLFRPYAPLGTENDADYKRLKACEGYEKDHFCSLQGEVNYNDLEAMLGAYKRYVSIISGRSQRVIGGIAATAAVTAATAGLAWFFVPAIAVAIAGESAAGLSV